MIVTEKPLFHGDNEKYWDNQTELVKGKLFLPRYWTTSPKDAIIHANTSARRHKSKLLVLCLKVWNKDDFELQGEGRICPEIDTEWYQRINMPGTRGLITAKITQKQFLEVYRQDELNKFVEKYCNPDQKRFYEELKQSLGK